MPIVHFTDSSGREWEVMDVRPSSTSTMAVSEGHESGWLAFNHLDERRRLAPIPADWQASDAPALEAFCRAARRVELARQYPARMPRTSRADAHPDRHSAASVHVVGAPGLSAVELPSDVQAFTREAAKTARTNDETVIAGLMTLRRLLVARDIVPGSAEFRAARQLFLEVYYFRG